MAPLTSNSNHSDSPFIVSNVDNGNLSNKNLALRINELVDHEVRKSSIFDIKAEDDMLKFHSTELELGRVLGRGGFCVVYELDAIDLLLGDDESDDNMSQVSRTSSLASLACVGRKRIRRKKATAKTLTTLVFDDENELVETRKSMSRLVSQTRKAKYVVKKVDPKLLDRDSNTYMKGTTDLVLEAKFLSSLKHPNIISMKAMTTARLDQELGYFIILDRMFDVLSKRLNQWMQRHRATKGMTGFITRGKKRSNDLLIERLMVANCISDAMSYLHSKGIVYRDLVSERTKKKHLNVLFFRDSRSNNFGNVLCLL
jgi:serine/threonine protein kinase